MSHIVTIKTELRDRNAIAAACRRLKLDAPLDCTRRLYGGNTAFGLAVKLPGWTYPIVADTSTGHVAYDNFNGLWGKQSELNRFLQAYGTEKAKAELRNRGMQVTETTDRAGNIILTATGGA